MAEESQKVILYIDDIFLNEEYKNAFSNNYELEKQMKIIDVNIYFYKKIDDEYNVFFEKGKYYIEKYKLD